jgi:hypothetical protein
MTVDHINIKIMAREPYPADLEKAIPVFHRWIQDQVLGELLVDVADYRHVPAGPGVMLIGHQSNYSLDLEFNRLGLLYNHKLPASGTFEDKLRDAFGAAVAACALLEEEPAFANELAFDAGNCEVIFNDRLLTPNTDETWQSVRPELDKFFTNLFGEGNYNLQRAGEPRERLRGAVHAKRVIPVKDLMEQTVSLSAKR